MAKPKSSPRYGIDSGKKRTLRDTTVNGIAALILGALKRTSCTTWTQYRVFLLKEETVNEAVANELFRWIDAALPLIHAGGVIDPDMIIASFDTAGRKVNGGYERSRDPRRLTDAQRLARNFTYFANLYRRGSIKAPSLEQELEARIAVPDDRLVVKRVVEESGLTPAGKIKPETLAKKLAAMGLPISGGHALTLRECVKQDLAAQSRAPAQKPDTKPLAPTPDPVDVPVAPIPAVAPAPEPEPIEPPKLPAQAPEPSAKERRPGTKRETLLADHDVVEHVAGPWVHPTLAWRLFHHHWPGSRNPITNRAVLKQAGYFRSRSASPSKGLEWRLSPSGLAESEGVLPSITPDIVRAWMQDLALEPEAPEPEVDDSPNGSSDASLEPEAPVAPVPPPSEPEPVPSGSPADLTVDDAKALLEQLTRKELVEVLRPFAKAAVLEVLAEFLESLRGPV